MESKWIAFEKHGDYNVMFIKVKLYMPPFRKAWSCSNRKYRPWKKKFRGKQYRYIVRLSKGSINEEEYGNAFGVRVYTLKATKRIFNQFVSLAKINKDSFNKVHDIIDPGFLYNKKVKLRGYIGNKAYFPTWSGSFAETNFI